MTETAIGLAISASLAQIGTNFDNLALLFALIHAAGRVPSIAAYAAAQTIVLLVSWGIGTGASGFGGGQIGLIGLLPIGLGVWGLRQRWGAGPDAAAPLPKQTSFGILVPVFLSLSGDSFAVIAPLFLDTAPHLRMAVAVGSAAAILVMSGAAWLASNAADRLGGNMRRAEVLSPYIMIAAGVYVLWNSATDAI